MRSRLCSPQIIVDSSSSSLLPTLKAECRTHMKNSTTVHVLKIVSLFAEFHLFCGVCFPLSVFHSFIRLNFMVHFLPPSSPSSSPCLVRCIVMCVIAFAFVWSQRSFLPSPRSFPPFYLFLFLSFSSYIRLRLHCSIVAVLNRFQCERNA